jgi:putative thioredoxin
VWHSPVEFVRLFSQLSNLNLKIVVYRKKGIFLEDDFPMTHEVRDFSKDVIEKSFTVPVVVDFWAEWCGPCKMLGPVLERLEGQSQGKWILAKVDTDRNEDLAVRYGVRGIPNVKLFVDGKVANEFTGALSERMVVQWLGKALPSQDRNELQRAEALAQEGKADEARPLLEGIVSRSPGNEEARVLLASTLLWQDRSRAVDLVRNIEEHSPGFPLADAIRLFDDLVRKMEHPEQLPQDAVKTTYLAAIYDMNAKQFDSALDKFIDVIRLNRYYDDDGARRACIVIFKLLGEEHEVTKRHRRDFSSALH